MAELDPQAQKILDLIRESGIPPYETMAPALAREYYEKACERGRGEPPEPAAIRDFSIPGPGGDIAVRLYRASDAPELPLLVFFHGGGFTIGSLDSHDALCRHLCVAAECLVLAVDYRLGPEHPFPAAADDAFAALCWAADHCEELGADPERIAVGGDSAGGNLSAVCCLLAREAAAPQIIYQLLIYPGTDMTESAQSIQTFGQGEYLLAKPLLHWFISNYVSADLDLKDWKMSPLYAPDHRGLPPAHVITAGFDPLQDEGIAYGKKLQQAGVPVSFAHYPGMMHGFMTQPRFLDTCREALQHCSDKLSRAFSSAN